MHDGVYSALDSQQYARNHLAQGAKTVTDISSEIAELVSYYLSTKTAPH
jgi:hypothetical protein